MTSTWPELPVKHLADRLRQRSDWVIGDFGCGECLLGKALPNEIKAFDHVAVNENVAACDMRKTPCENESLDAAVFCLSLMGTNWSEYLQEAHRTLKPLGQLLIAEPQKKWEGKTDDLVQVIRAAGFRLVGKVEQRDRFLYVLAIKV